MIELQAAEHVTLSPNTVSLSWSTILAIVGPMALSVAGAFKWMASRVDRAQLSLAEDLKARDARDDERQKTQVDIAVSLAKISATQDLIVGRLLEEPDQIPRKTA